MIQTINVDIILYATRMKLSEISLWMCIILFVAVFEWFFGLFEMLELGRQGSCIFIFLKIYMKCIFLKQVFYFFLKPYDRLND